MHCKIKKDNHQVPKRKKILRKENKELTNNAVPHYNKYRIY